MINEGFYVMMQDGTNSRKFSLCGKKYLIGKNPGCDIRINRIEVSPEHAEIFASKDGQVRRRISKNNDYVKIRNMTSNFCSRSSSFQEK